MARKSRAQIRIRSLFLALLLFFYGFPIAKSEQTAVTVNSSAWPPYIDPELKHRGVLGRIILESFERAGYKATLIFRPWKRALLEGKMGKVDAVAFSVLSKKRAGDFIFSEILYHAERRFYHLKNRTFDWTELEDLAGLRIGVDAGFSYLPAFQQLGDQGLYAIIINRNAKANLRQLLSGRIDLYAMTGDYPEYVLKTEFNKSEEQRVIYHPRPFNSPTFHLIFGKLGTRPGLMRDAFNKGLRELRLDGSYDRYMAESRRGDYLP